jgi:hypothetical protein
MAAGFDEMRQRAESMVKNLEGREPAGRERAAP